jgi:transcription initiation factor TFIID subunit TAF12
MVNPITARSTTALQLNYQGLTLSQVLKLNVDDLISSFEKQCGGELDKNVVDLLKKNKFNGEKLIYLNKSDLISWGLLGEKIGDEEGKKMINLILSSAVETVKNDASGTLYFTSAAQLQQQSEQQPQQPQQQQQPQQPQQNTGQ